MAIDATNQVVHGAVPEASRSLSVSSVSSSSSHGRNSIVSTEIMEANRLRYASHLASCFKLNMSTLTSSTLTSKK